MIFFSLLLLTVQSLSAQTNLSCESNRSIILSDGSQANAETYRLFAMNQGQIIRFAQARGALIYNSTTGQFFEEDSNGRRHLLRRSPTGEYAVLENAQTRNPVYRPIATPLRTLIALIEAMGRENFRNQVEACGNRQTFREQLRNPMADIEVNKCRHDLELLNRISRCLDQNNCSGVFNDLNNVRTTSPPYSFVRIFNERMQVTDPVSRLAVPFAVDSAASMGVTNTLLLNKARIGALASRVGMRFLGVFSLINALMSTTKPIIFALVYDDQCGSENLNESAGRSIEDCVGRSANSLMSQFGQDIENAIANPEQFIQQIDQASNGLNGRLACYAIENQMIQWSQRLSEYQPYTCQGRMIVTGNGQNYILGENNSFYRHESRERTYHFNLNSPMQIENRDTQVRSTPIPVNEIPSGTISADQVIPMRIVYEETIMAAMLPQFLQEFENGVCRVTPPTEHPEPSSATQ